MSFYDPYANYEEWKNWTPESFGKISNELAGAYRYIIDTYAGRSSGTALDFGFGNGEMLAVLKNCSFDCTGVEINPKLVALAHKAGFRAAESLEDLPRIVGDAQFGVITAFHILEHIERDRLVPLLVTLAQRLSAGGRLIAAFPNGDSPFSASAFNGDITHRTLIGSSMARQIGRLSGLELVTFAEFPAPTMHSARVLKRIKACARLWVEHRVSNAIATIYFGSTSIVLSPTALAVWEKP